MRRPESGAESRCLPESRRENRNSVSVAIEPIADAGRGRPFPRQNSIACMQHSRHTGGTISVHVLATTSGNLPARQANARDAFPMTARWDSLARRSRRQTSSRSLLLGCLAGAVLSAPAGAKDLQLAGKFAFQTDGNLDKATCTRLTQATASRLSSRPYRCERTRLSSGKTALLCSRPPGGRGGYMVFDTKAECDSERKDQANAE